MVSYELHIRMRDPPKFGPHQLGFGGFGGTHLCLLPLAFWPFSRLGGEEFGTMRVRPVHWQDPWGGALLPAGPGNAPKHLWDAGGPWSMCASTVCSRRPHPSLPFLLFSPLMGGMEFCDAWACQFSRHRRYAFAVP